MVTSPERYVFMDEGGDSETCLALTALTLIGPVHEHENEADRLVRGFASMFALPDDFELHGVALLRDARLKPFQRDFVFQQALDFVSRLPDVRVFSLYWDWWPDPPQRPGDPKAHRLRRLYREMLDWLNEDATMEEYEVAEIVYDKLSQQPHIEREHRRWVDERGSDRILVAPRFDDSKGSRLLQLVDIAVHAVHLAERRVPPTAKSGASKRTRRKRAKGPREPSGRVPEVPSRAWYRERLAGCFPTSVTHSGVRRVDVDRS